MSKIKSTLILSVAALCLSATPSFAQYGSGSSYGNQTPRTSAPSNVRKAKQTISKAEKRRMEAQKHKEAMEAKLAQQEQNAQSYGSGTKPAEKSYGSGTKASSPSYGSGTKDASGTKSRDVVMEKGDAMMEKGDTMMKEEVMMEKGDTMMKDKASSYGSGSEAPAYGSGTATPATALPINCPTGTTAQPNGTCLITSGSFPIG